MGHPRPPASFRPTTQKHQPLTPTLSPPSFPTHIHPSPTKHASGPMADFLACAQLLHGSIHPGGRLSIGKLIVILEFAAQPGQFFLEASG